MSSDKIEKYYNIGSGTKGFDNDRGEYIEFPVEDEYFQMLREDENESDSE